MAMLGWPWTIGVLSQTAVRTSVANLLLAAAGFTLGAALALPVDSEERMLHAEAKDRALRLSANLMVRQISTGSCGAGLASAVEGRDPLLLGWDPWGERWIVRCHGERLVVLSTGADRTVDTEDDVISIGDLDDGLTPWRLRVLEPPSDRKRRSFAASR